MGSPSEAPDILPVPRTKQEARRFYDRMSGVYDWLTGRTERKFAELALQRLSVEEGESVLEIGFGTGYCLMRIAESVGEKGKAHGVDISPGMLGVAQGRLSRAGLADSAQLYLADAASLPYRDDTFDAIFMSYTLELFDTGEIPKVLQEIGRVLRPGGRIAVAGMSRENGEASMLKLYEWAHMKWPRYLDCRPIYVERSLRDAGYEIASSEKVSLFGLPNEIVVAVKAVRLRAHPQASAGRP